MESFLEQVSALETISALLIASLNEYGLIALCLAIFLFGETAIVIALLLTQQNVLGVSDVLIAATIGTLLADIFWFSIGRYYPTQLIPSTLQRRLLTPTSDVFTDIIRGRIFLSLLLLRFFIGTRLMLIIYISRERISWVRFLIYDLLGTLVYLLLFTVLGVYLGKTIVNMVPAFQLTTSILSGLLLVVLLSLITKRMLGTFTQSKIQST